MRLERGVACRTHDGVTLRSDHYYPPRGDPAPTLLMRQPYGRDIASTVVYRHPAWYARRGYNVVIQDVRGRGDSEGDFYPFRHEARDGFDTVEWVAARPECNGKVGMYGFSYQGSTQLLAAVEQPPALRCIAPAMTAADLYSGWFYQNGALRLASALGWGTQMLKGDARRIGSEEAGGALEAAWTNLRGEYNRLPFAGAAALREYVGMTNYARDWVTHREPGEYWSAIDLSTRYDRIRVPALHLSGWYDLYGQGSVDGYVALRARAGSGFARQHQYLIAGPWVHIPWGEKIGEADCGLAACPDTDAWLLRWFNHWLMDMDCWENEPHARVFVLGANVWRTAETFPAAAKECVFHLGSDGDANSRKGGGQLLDHDPAGSQPPDIFVDDPEVPVLAPGGPEALAGAFDQARLELGNNLLVYTTPPLAEPLKICGQPRLSFHASTSAAPADFTGKLVRVEPSGRAWFVCLGYARSTALFGASYQPDVAHRWEFLLDATACLFQPGERVRLEIASSAFPLFERHPNTTTAPAEAMPADWRRSTQIVWHDAARPATLTLPLTD